MALCVPKVMILGHSFIRRLSCDLDEQFDIRAKRNFDLNHVNVRLFGVWGRTVKKIKDFDLGMLFCSVSRKLVRMICVAFQLKWLVRKLMI